jgi:ribonuclease HII
LADSKTLSARRREELSILIRERAFCWALGRAEVEEIDRLNILQASLLAMQRAVMALSIQPELVLVDGNQAPRLVYPITTIIRGDSVEPSISAASILAKVARDAEMCDLDRHYPGYGFSIHKGYPTRAHIEALQKQGVSSVHRRSFRPVQQVLAAETCARNSM